MSTRVRPPRLPGPPSALAAAPPREHAITFDFEGAPVRAFAGQTLAVALWASGLRTFMRSPKYHRPRGPFCFAGHCGSCALRVDGAPGRVSCMIPATPDLRCEREPAFPSTDADLLRAGDWLFPHGLDHHHAMTKTRIGNRLFVKLARQVGGGGALPDLRSGQTRDHANRSEHDVHVDVCIVGAGPAGLGAACVLAQALRRDATQDLHETLNPRVLVVDEAPSPGGSLAAEPGGWHRTRRLAQEAQARGLEIWSRARALGYFPEDDHPPGSAAARARARAGRPPAGILAIARDEAEVVRISAGYTLYTTGSTDQNLPFGNNDRPGILAARACGRLIFLHGVTPADRITFVTQDPPLPYTERLRDALGELGFRVQDLSPAEAARTRLGHGAFAVCALPAPAFELPRQHGAEIRYSASAGGFAIVATPDGETRNPNVRAAGDVTGYVGPEAAYTQGQRAARALLQALGWQDEQRYL